MRFAFPPYGPTSEQWLMKVLKAYFDNSGEEVDPQHRVCSIAGFITTSKKWRKFEKLWKQTLSDYEVPYLHMREYAHNLGPFEKYRDNVIERKLLLQSLINIMEEVNLNGIASIIRLDDLKRFNVDNNLSIESFALNLYTCMTLIYCHWENDIVEIIIDKIDRSNIEISKARSYADTDIYFPDCGKNIRIDALEKELSFREITPLQAADFLAWEARKDIDTKDEWFQLNPDIGEDGKKLFQSLKVWCKQKLMNFPYHRQSLTALLKHVPTAGVVWNYNQLCHIHKARKEIWP